MTVTAPKKRSLFAERFLMYTGAGISSSVPQHTAGSKVAKTPAALLPFGFCQTLLFAACAWRKLEYIF